MRGPLLPSAGQAAAVQLHPCATQMQKSPFLPSPRQSLLFSHRMLYLNPMPGPDRWGGSLSFYSSFLFPYSSSCKRGPLLSDRHSGIASFHRADTLPMIWAGLSLHCDLSLQVSLPGSHLFLLPANPDLPHPPKAWTSSKRAELAPRQHPAVSTTRSREYQLQGSGMPVSEPLLLWVLHVTCFLALTQPHFSLTDMDPCF